MKINRPQSRQAMPSNAKKVFSGIVYDVYHYPVKGYDGKYAIFEKLKRLDTVMVIAVTTDKKIVIAEQEQPGKKKMLTFLGGRIEKKEPVLKAAERELLEESGYRARKWRVLSAIQPVSKIEWAVYVLIAQGCRFVTNQKLDGTEKIKLKYVSFNKLIDLMCSGKIGDLELRCLFLEAKLNPQKMKTLKNKIIGN